MKRRGPDSLEGLFIALICCLITTLMFGTTGLSSMLFVASITRYNTDRNRASFPFVLCTVLQAVSGLFAGYLAKRFNTRVVVLAGSILAFLGIGTCFFAEDIMTVTILWGIVYGTGFGLSTLLLPVIINEYFFKRRSVALGMCFLGSPIGFLIFPPIFEIFLKEYDLSGTFLILSGINMHCIPLSLLLTTPNFKASDETSPLNHGEKYDSYSSTDSKGSNRIQKSKFENKTESETNGTVESCARRHSVEFLWQRCSSTEQITHQEKKYVLSLNKNSYDKERNNSDIMRSFKTTKSNHYVNLDKKDHKICKDVLSSVKNDKGNDAKIRKETLSGSKIFTALNFNQNTNSNSFSSTKNHRLYEEISTIYFGSEQNSSTSIHCEPNMNGYLNHGYVSENQLNSVEISLVEKSGDIPVIESKGSVFPILLKYRKFDEFLIPTTDDICGKKSDIAKIDKESCPTPQNSLINMYLNPIFILICIINAIINLHFTALTTVIIDFSRDLKIDVENEKYVMMCISLTGAFGMLGFGWVTDSGYLTRSTFGSLTQLVGSISTAVFPFTVGFGTLTIPLAVWCICQSSFIPLIPAIIAEYFNEDIQTVAVSSCNVLSGPLYLVIPPLIGYFRDDKGSYDSIFYLLGILSFINCIAVFTIPYLARWQSKIRRR